MTRQFLILDEAGASPITVAVAKAHLREESNEFDTMIEGFIAAALAVVDGPDGILDRAILSQTWILKRDLFLEDECVTSGFDGEIVLPLAPLQQVTSVQYLDTAGDLQTLDPAAWRVVDRGRKPSSIMPASGSSWPSILSNDPEAVQITFDCGWEDADAVPAPIIQAMLLMIGDWYAVREGTTLDDLTKPVRNAVDALLAPYRTISI